jgi:small nuclear ribonucleoprotein G
MGKGGPELASYMEKTLSLKMDAGRHIEGVLRGYDPFLNIVLDQVSHFAFSHFLCMF